MGRILRFVVALSVLGVVATFQIGSAAQTGPSVAARDQRLSDGVVIVESVVAPEPGWVDIHSEAEVAGNPGAVIGYAPVQPGDNNYVFVEVDPAQVTPVLYAVLHADRGQPGTFEFPGADQPVKLDGASVTAAFHVLHERTRSSSDAPGLSVRDQPLRNGEVVVGRVVASQAGWVDIHAEAEQAGNPGPVIGYSPIDLGETTYLRVSVPADQVTQVLYTVLHVDEGERGKFEFPGPDRPVQLDGRSVVAPFRVLQVAPATGPGSTAIATHSEDVAAATSATVTQASTAPPSATATSTATPMSTAAATSAPAATRTAAPAATPTSAATATQAAGPAAMATSVPTATPSASPVASPTPMATATRSAQEAPATMSVSPTPAAGTVAGDTGGPEVTPAALPRTGRGLGPVGEILPLGVAGIAVLFLLSGIALRKGGLGNGHQRQDG